MEIGNPCEKKADHGNWGLKLPVIVTLCLTAPGCISSKTAQLKHFSQLPETVKQCFT